jgi:predicted site-specific integrase-resolvase
MQHPDEYLGGKDASETLGVHQRTLYQWESKGLIDTIRTPGGKRLYNVKKYINIHKQNKIEELDENEIDNLGNEDKKLYICYVRVSSHGQKDDMERQKQMLMKKYPKHTFITDIGSGINFNRKGLRKIIDLAISNKIEEVVVAHKDRLTRFGFDFIEDLIKKYSNGKILVVNAYKKLEPQDELVMDVMQVLNVFVAKMNGLRKYGAEKE